MSRLDAFGCVAIAVHAAFETCPTVRGQSRVRGHSAAPAK
jgi:hypothetical protein